jgi:hypothetical protein
MSTSPMQAMDEVASSEVVEPRHLSAAYPLSERIVAVIGSFVLAAMAVMACIVNAMYEGFNPARLSVVLGLLIGVHVLCFPRVLFTRECTVYATFLGYMGLSILWAPDAILALNTLLPGVNFLLLMVLFGSLVTFHDVRRVLLGIFFGFALCACVYTATQRFPLVRPVDFPYNAVAGMYLLGLFAILAWGCYVRHGFLCLLVALVIMLHIVATTSIKTNLGVMLGVIAAGVFYFRNFAGVLRTYAVALVAVSVAIAYGIISNDALLERIETGYSRVSMGLEILSAREDAPKGTSITERQDWKRIGLLGWAKNPVFGNGVEAFRADQGITSHSTPIDLLYNFGVIGLVLYYGVFGTLLERLFRMPGTHSGQLRALVVAGVTCYVFISLSGTMLCNSFLAIFIGTSTALLKRQLPNMARVL